MRQGQSIYEVVLAIGVVTAVLVAIVALVSLTQRNAILAKNRAKATRLTQEASEWLRSQRNTDWNIFYAKAGSPAKTWCLNNLDFFQQSSCSSSQYVTNNEPFRREVNLTSVNVTNGLQVRADIDVRWTDQQGTHNVTSTTYFTNWQ